MSRTGRRRRLIAVSLLAGSLMLVWAPDAAGTVPGGNGKIAFVYGPPWGEVFTIDPDGTHLARITPMNGPQERDPAWSPDGTQLVLTSRAPSQGFLWIMNADGSNRRQLTFDDGGPFHNDID